MSHAGEIVRATESFRAGGTVVGQRFIKYGTAEREMVQCGAGELATGVAAWDASSGSISMFYPLEGGSLVLVEAGDTVALHDPLASDADGKAVPAAEEDVIVGYAEEAGDDGDKIMVRLNPGGIVVPAGDA